MNESVRDQDAGSWIRKAVSVKDTDAFLFLHDRRGSVEIEGGRIVKADVAGKDEDPVCFSDYIDLMDGEITVEETYHLVVHPLSSRGDFPTDPDARRDNLSPLFPLATTGKKVIALQVTTEGCLSLAHLGTQTIAGNQYVWLSMKDRAAYRKVADWLSEFTALDFETANSIASAPDRSSLARFEGVFSHLLDITHPGDPTAPLAFRLLCEAWEAEQVDGVGEPSGFAITAPKIPSDWLAPFVRPDGQVANVQEVVALMDDEDFKGKVKAVLDATDGESTKKAVLTLLGRTDPPPATEGGAE